MKVVIIQPTFTINGIPSTIGTILAIGIYLTIGTFSITKIFSTIGSFPSIGMLLVIEFAKPTQFPFLHTCIENDYALDF